MKKFDRRIKYTADFETTTDINDCRVWAWAVSQIGDSDNFIYGNDISTFIEFCQGKKNYDLYFHNLKFDGEFILYYLLSNGYKHIKNKKEKENKTFTTLISDDGKFYSIEIFFEVGNKRVNSVRIYDSLKILNMSVLDVAKAFGLGELAEQIKEEKIDYDKFREVGHEITDEELRYLKNDVVVMSKALDTLFKEDLTKMTQGSNALADYKKILNESNFNYYFPVLPYEIDHELRKSYKGGFCFVNPCNQDKILYDLMTLDVNSLYPSVMYYNLLPVGNPIYYEGKYEYDKYHPLYIQCFSACFELKEGYLPTLLSKKAYKNKNEFITSSNGEVETMVLTNVDYELFKKHYNVTEETFINGYKFQGKLHLFDSYIEKWITIKIESKKNGNKGMYQIAKIMLNSLYGKFGLNPNVASKTPYLSEEGIVKYHTEETEERDSIYIPMASFITSYARRKTIETSQIISEFSRKEYGEDYYIYSDTDSIHLRAIDLEILSKIVDIDDYKLGAWKLEARPQFGKYIRQKSYIDMIDGVYQVTCAGMSKSCIKYSENKDKVYYKIFEEDNWKEFDINDFKVGFFCGGKLSYKHVKRWCSIS